MNNGHIIFDGYEDRSGEPHCECEEPDLPAQIIAGPKTWERDGVIFTRPDTVWLTCGRCRAVVAMEMGTRPPNVP